MKTLHYTLISLLTVSLISCKKDGKTNESPKDSLTAKKDSVAIPEIHKEYYGVYTGDFAGMEKVVDDVDGTEYEENFYKKISIKINRITKDSVYGQSIVNGNQRPVRGVFNETSKSFVLDEPGNDKTDGRFEVKLNGDSLTGKWNAFNKKAVKAPLKSLKLIKKDFVYNPNFMLDPDSNLVDWNNPKDFVEKYTDSDGKTESYTTSKNRVASDAVFKLNASKQKLSEKDIKNLRKLDMEIIKNSVFARHGYSFKKETYRDFFEQTDWYIPVSNNVDNELSPLEKDNVALLNRFIKYAEDKYDSFGR
ncbi:MULTISPECIES: YARHG domain-containing protein [unclassified Chryseobacterium]|uniref:YARHG domain-containing protein n=1 Tax=unclassified Chryseobacterium TaxID=2593645 RepID=UPI00100BF276|nr:MULTISPECIES: YARHG domain-containing protein [unclassified Chryseobacterium]RXM52273.1 serine/threonine protein kinase [Chryseobacterium sp. CH25]RXM64180.1 serine/threonine protein kinase [Chryseobacterium sp. CH1]